LPHYQEIQPAAWAEKEREIEAEEKEIKVEKFEKSIKKETPIEPSIIIQSPVEEKKEIRKKQSINNKRAQEVNKLRSLLNC